MAKDKFSDLQQYVLTTALKKGSELTRESIFKNFYKTPATRSSSASVSRSLKSLKEQGYLTIDRNKMITLTDDGRDIARILTTSGTKKHRPTSVIEEPPIYRYMFGAKTFYVDPNSPEQQKRAREFRVQITATKLSEALDLAEQRIRQESGGFEFSIMTQFGSTVTIYPPRKKE